MDVTCERCGTEYDFDDALVSERGTTVKCTNCGAQFRVFRQAPAGGPERWVVRTVDGRELVFSALRELQAAISTGVVGREDVLSRGAGRPRRLGSIAELEPFFKQAVVLAATSTAPGLGLPSARAPQPQRQDGSVAIPLPRAEEPQPKRSGTLPPPPPILHTAPERSEVRATGARGADPMISTAVTGSMQPTSVAATGHAVRLQNLVAADLSEAVTMPRSDAVAQAIARDQTLPVPVGPMSSAHAAPAIVTSPIARAPAESVPQESVAVYADTVAAIHEPVARVEGAVARAPLEEAEARARKPDESGVVERRGAPSTPSAPVTEQPTKPSRDVIEERKRAALLTPITPSPGEVRVSYIPEPEPSVSPRFSMATSQKRGGSVRWIVGVVLLGATALLAATVGRKYLVTAPAPTAATAPASDERVVKLVEEGEKSLADGDLDAAKEKLDKASALAENDPRVVTLLARLAVVRADLRWLKVRILPSEGAEAALAKAELADAVEKMKRAVDTAKAVLPNDATVRRCRVDALRIAGDRSAARALVGEMPAAGKTLDDELTLAALDLGEPKPVWPTVIERLRGASAADGNLGRARSMLVYALAASGDPAGAKAEHDRLAALARPHPLTATLLVFMARMETDQPAATAPPVTAGTAKPSAAPTTAPTAAATSVPGPVASSQPGATPPGGRVPDDYVAPGAGSVDVSDMGHHPPSQPTTPPAQTAPPAPSNTTPPGVDTSDLPGFGKQ
jgi:predicted Zn finger-like uncharacterized protein